jgi:uncharacterized protein (TIGR02300 family)
MLVAKPEWGIKRVCQSCAAKFYDMKRSPITCPKCAAPFDPEALLKSRRSRPSPAKAAKPVPPPAAPAPEKPAADETKVDEDADADAENTTASDDDSDDSSVLQDASELGDDGVSGVAVPSKDSES